MSVAIGIDLGTTNTVVAAVVDGVAVTLEDEQKRRLLPSVVSFHPSGTVLVGEAARERRLIDPDNTVFSVKPLLGRPWDSEEVQAARLRFPFKLVEGAKNSTMVLARDVAYALPEISAFVLRRAKAIAESALGQAVDRAVITVPANFNELQRASTKIAGKLAGLEVMRIINEPTAAALAYGQSIARAEKIAIYDLGGGTFDVTLLDLTGNVFEVLATAGDTALGGDDIDRTLASKIALDVLKKFNVDPRTNPVAAARLSFVAEELKKELSTGQHATREVSDVGYAEGGRPISMLASLTRQELEVLTHPLIERTISVARQSIEIIGLAPRDFDRVILVGGSTRMPLVARMVEQLFGQPPHLKVNPDEVVALGAAIQAHALNRTKGPQKRRSAHDQLADAQPKTGRHITTSPPQANPTPAAADVPKAPPVPTNLRAPAPTAPVLPSFNKAPATIAFASRFPPASPQAQATAAPAPAPPRAPAPPVPVAPGAAAKPPRPPPPVPKPRAPTLPEIAPEQAAAPPPPRRSAPSELELAMAALPLATPYEPEAARGPAGSGEIAAIPELDLALPLPADAPHEEADEERSLELELAGPTVTAEQFDQGSAIETSASTPLLIDVTPLSLGVETVGGYADILIPANSPVPCEKTRTFLTATDHQTVVSIRVAQGESSRFADNTRLGDVELSGLRSARRGEVKVVVTFELDADGILNVRARDQDTGRETAATMRLLGAATDVEDIGAMAARQARHHVA